MRDDFSVVQRGTGGLPVMLVHGLGGDKSVWSAQLDHLATRRRVAALDLRGHGASPTVPSGDYSVEAFAKDVAAAGDALRWRTFVLVGHSLGASIIGAFARARPKRVAGLVFVDPTADLTRVRRAELDRVLRSLDDDYVPAIESWYRRLLVNAGADVKRQVLGSLRATPREVVVSALHAVCRYDPLPGIDSCVAPKLAVINPELHRAPSSLHRVARGLNVHEMAGVSHWPMLDRPAEFNAVLDAFLARCSG